MSEKINLEDLAQTAPEPEKKQEDRGPVQNDTPTPQKEVEKIMSLPFTVAMQNLGLEEKEVIEVAEELLLKGNVKKKIELPLGSYVVLESKKAADELDYFTFIMEAISKQYSQAEFDYMMRIRNLAVSLVEMKLGDVLHDFRDKSIEDRMEFLLNLSSAFISIILNASQKFWAVLLLMMHPKALDFLTKTLQK